jgi:predicted double-glycine peptidase
MPVRFWQIPHRAIRVPVPDTNQLMDFTCGASSLQAVCLYYGVSEDNERELARVMGIDPRVGAHPDQVVDAARHYGLHVREEQPMTVRSLRNLLDEKKPVLCMIQAWGERRKYRDDWQNGHWVVAIGYDSGGIYFEDPVISEARGYLSFPELEERWHDLGRRNRQVSHYGVALWKPRARTFPRRIPRARRIP